MWQMSRKHIHLLFSFIFIVFITAPSMVSLIDDCCDMSMFCGLGEDEKEKEEKEGQKTFEVNFIEVKKDDNSAVVFDLKLDNRYYLNTFKELHTEDVSPPPEHI